jgi:hypothetical protein
MAQMSQSLLHLYTIPLAKTIIFIIMLMAALTGLIYSYHQATTSFGAKVRNFYAIGWLKG